MSKILCLGDNSTAQIINISHIMHVHMHEKTPCSFELYIDLVGSNRVTIPYSTKDVMFSNFLYIKEAMKA